MRANGLAADVRDCGLRVVALAAVLAHAGIPMQLDATLHPDYQDSAFMALTWRRFRSTILVSTTEDSVGMQVFAFS